MRQREIRPSISILLEAGTDLDPALPEGLRVGSALKYTARNASDRLALKTLLDFGAEIEASSVEGITPLIHAARTDNHGFAMLLLKYGAEVNATDALGQTPMTTAIAYNSHKALQLLLDR